MTMNKNRPEKKNVPQKGLRNDEMQHVIQNP